MSGRGRGPGWSEVLRVHPTPRWGGSMPAFHPRSGLCCCLFASSARAALSWGADGPVPPRTSGAAGRPLCGLAGKSSPGTEHGAQPCTKPSCRTVPALPTSFPAPGGQGEVSISTRGPSRGRPPPGRPQGLRDRTQAAAKTFRAGMLRPGLGRRPRWPRRMAVPSWSPLGPRATSFLAAPPPRSPWAPCPSLPTPHRVLPVAFAPHPCLAPPRPRELARAAWRGQRGHLSWATKIKEVPA